MDQNTHGTPLPQNTIPTIRGGNTSTKRPSDEPDAATRKLPKVDPPLGANVYQNSNFYDETTSRGGNQTVRGGGGNRGRREQRRPYTERGRGRELSPATNNTSATPAALNATTNRAPSKTTPNNGNGGNSVPPRGRNHFRTESERREAIARLEQPSETDSWPQTPNKLARRILRDTGVNEAAITVKDQTLEPEYACRDVEIRDAYWQVIDDMEKFVRKHFVKSKNLRCSQTVPNVLIPELSPETVKIIGCVASGGPGGAAGWLDLFLNDSKRVPLIIAIISNVITEQVYQHVFFGCTAEQEATIAQIQRKYRNEDGFQRIGYYAQFVSEQLNYDNNTRDLKLPKDFHTHAKAIVAAIYLHLHPFVIQTEANFNDLILELYSIVAKAGILSLIMRTDPHTAYYFTPVFKDDKFDSKAMDCFNRRQMQELNPRERADWPTNYTEANIRRARSYEAVTQITITEGLTAYRVGGWEQPASTLGRRVYVDNLAIRGIRSRQLAHGWVYARWGRMRSFQDAKPNDDPAIHGAEWDGGFIEFKEVDKVQQPPSPPRRLHAATRPAATTRVRAVVRRRGNGGAAAAGGTLAAGTTGTARAAGTTGIVGTTGAAGTIIDTGPASEDCGVSATAMPRASGSSKRGDTGTGSNTSRAGGSQNRGGRGGCS
ncbi:hypothetical protein B0J11DRAFT_184147 [Dendryphion nanum]|uniref:Uncharacterized protein n=1 Tax=Dendryphion nanum TaxID=256645 RepID=A0A9P9D4B8_9PLEO|nr:hypothetical protein B0J11DRAFT_184147 [Dendryphion nanum]